VRGVRGPWTVDAQASASRCQHGGFVPRIGRMDKLFEGLLPASMLRQGQIAVADLEQGIGEPCCHGESARPRDGNSRTAEGKFLAVVSSTRPGAVTGALSARSWRGVAAQELAESLARAVVVLGPGRSARRIDSKALNASTVRVSARAD